MNEPNQDIVSYQTGQLALRTFNSPLVLRRPYRSLGPRHEPNYNVFAEFKGDSPILREFFRYTSRGDKDLMFFLNGFHD